MRFKTRLKEFLNRSDNIFFKSLKFIFIYCNKFFIYPFQLIAKLVDILFIPIAIFYQKKGINVFEAKTSSFGHHLFEPVAICVLNNLKNKSNQKELILLAKKSKAYVKYTNKLLSQKFKVIDSYSFINIYYWLARNKFCGLTRNSMYREHMDIFYEVHFKYKNQLNIFDLEILKQDEVIKSIIKKLNPQNKYIVLWKPRCNRWDKSTPIRNSSLDSCLSLFDKIHSDGGIIFGVLYGSADIKHPGLVDLRQIKEQDIREKFIFYLDATCKYAIAGQTGGTVPLHIFMKPMLVYDAAYPYTIHFSGPKTIVSLKKSYYPNGQEVRIETLLALKSQKEIQDLGIRFQPNSAIDILKLHAELLQRMEENRDEFLPESYDMNIDWGEGIPRNIYNRFGHSQIANYCYKNQKKALAPKQLINN